MSERLRFDHYVERCLYHPVTGFYTSRRGIAGRRGDFITSPEVGPLFGAVLANALDRWWDDAGQPDPFVVVDAGTGPGTLLRALEAAAPRCSAVWELRGMDIASPDAGSRGDGWQAQDLAGVVVIANELLDNLPFRVVERSDAGWCELFVESGTELLEHVDDPPPLLEELNLDVGQRIPLHTAATTWVERTLDAGVLRLVAFDYGAPTTVELAGRGGWLRTYRDHQRGSDPLFEPGQWDITTDVGFDQLPAPIELMSQADFLVRHRIDALVEEGRQWWLANASRPDVAALRMRSRVSEAAALCDPEGLGGWLVASWA